MRRSWSLRTRLAIARLIATAPAAIAPAATMPRSILADAPALNLRAQRTVFFAARRFLGAHRRRQQRAAREIEILRLRVAARLLRLVADATGSRAVVFHQQLRVGRRCARRPLLDGLGDHLRRLRLAILIVSGRELRGRVDRRLACLLLAAPTPASATAAATPRALLLAGLRRTLGVRLLVRRLDRRFVTSGLDRLRLDGLFGLRLALLARWRRACLERRARSATLAASAASPAPAPPLALAFRLAWLGVIVAGRRGLRLAIGRLRRLAVGRIRLRRVGAQPVDAVAHHDQRRGLVGTLLHRIVEPELHGALGIAPNHRQQIMLERRLSQLLGRQRLAFALQHFNRSFQKGHVGPCVTTPGKKFAGSIHRLY